MYRILGYRKKGRDEKHVQLQLFLVADFLGKAP